MEFRISVSHCLLLLKLFFAFCLQFVIQSLVYLYLFLMFSFNFIYNLSEFLRWGTIITLYIVGRISSSLVWLSYHFDLCRLRLLSIRLTFNEFRTSFSFQGLCLGITHSYLYFLMLLICFYPVASDSVYVLSKPGIEPAIAMIPNFANKHFNRQAY